MKRLLITAFIVTGVLASCGSRPASSGREPVVGLPCENCEDVFVGMPDSLSWSARIAPENEPGEPLRIDGLVRDREGRAVGGIIVYAYHTDSRGIYPRDERHGLRHGRLRGWARTNADGRYRFDTIRPAGYPGTDLPQHVHMHIIEPGRCTYWIDDIHFTDDPRLTAAMREQFDNGRGGGGFAGPTRTGDGVWHVRRDITLGENIPGHPGR